MAAAKLYVPDLSSEPQFVLIEGNKRYKMQS